MAISMNRAILVGRVGADPEKRGREGQIAALRIATSESWKDKRTGERQERTQWHNISVLSEPTAKFVLQYVKKGDMVLVEGQIETREWDKDGEKRYSTEIVVRPFGGQVQLQSKDGGGRSGGSGGDDADGYSYGGDDRSSGRSSGSAARDLDDEIPF